FVRLVRHVGAPVHRLRAGDGAADPVGGGAARARGGRVHRGDDLPDRADRGPDLRMEERGAPMGLGKGSRQALPVVPKGEPSWLTTKLDFVVNWARRNSLWPMPFGTACCAIEMMAAAASRYDVARSGMERMSFSPRQADLLICAGRVTYKMAPVLRRIWDQMPQPKWAIAMGACAS